MKTITEYLSKKLDARLKYRDERLKELGKTEEEFAESKELRNQINSEFNEIWKLKKYNISL